MPAAAREFFTVDLRGLRAALAARAASQGMTESEVLRNALAAALGSGARSTTIELSRQNDDSHAAGSIKLSVRLLRLAAHRLDGHARAAGLSRGAYLSRLIQDAPPVMASADRGAGFAALSASSTELAVLSRDINHLTQLLRRGAVDAARQYRERLDNLDADVRAHLDKAALTLAELSPLCVRAGRAPPRAFKPRSTP
jgi:HPt (histidine-containing phosphotransfer) domain-containing protein